MREWSRGSVHSRPSCAAMLSSQCHSATGAASSHDCDTRPTKITTELTSAENRAEL